MAADAWSDRVNSRKGECLQAGVTAVVVAVVLAVALAGCAKRSRAPGAAGDDRQLGLGVGEDRLASGSSLARAHRGLPPEEDGILKDVRFRLDSYDLDPEARAVLAQNTEWLKANGGVPVEIEGHADERGTIEYNLALGARRAKAVKDYLSILGVEMQRMTTISYGEELPVCRESSEECWRRNRRVHFVVLSP